MTPEPAWPKGVPKKATYWTILGLEDGHLAATLAVQLELDQRVDAHALLGIK